jgi:hypothetical protein
MTRLDKASAPDGITPPAPHVRKPSVSYPRLAAEPNFVFIAHAEAWLVLHGLIVPRLGKAAMQPGVNRVDSTGDPTDALAFYRRRGWTPIPVDIDAEGDPTDGDKPHPSYVKAYRVKPKGRRDQDYEPQQFAHMDRWITVYPGSPQITEGGLPYAKWCRSLVDRGVIPDILPHVTERLLADAERLLEEYEARNSPKLRGAVAAQKQTMKVLRAAMKTAAKAPVEAMTPPKPRGKAANAD